jgi:hypothetical protein
MTVYWEFQVYSEMINPYPANVEKIVIMPANGKWDLIQRLKG